MTSKIAFAELSAHNCRNGTAKTREAKTIVCYTAGSGDSKAGEPRKDEGSGAAGVRIDSARADGAGRTSDFAERLERTAHRNGAFKAKEVAVLADGAVWIWKAVEEIFAGQDPTFILDQCHALDYAAAAVRALAPDKDGRKAWMAKIKEQLNDGKVTDVIADLRPYRKRDEAVEACIRYF